MPTPSLMSDDGWRRIRDEVLPRHGRVIDAAREAGCSPNTMRNNFARLGFGPPSGYALGGARRLDPVRPAPEPAAPADDFDAWADLVAEPRHAAEVRRALTWMRDHGRTIPLDALAKRLEVAPGVVLQVCADIGEVAPW